MYTKEQQAWLDQGNKITICPPYNRNPDPKKGPVYSKSRARSGCYLPPARNLDFNYSK
jgi:hypothetical protein